MISSKKLFKTYNLKSWKQDKFQIFLSITAITIAVAILVTIQLVLSITKSYMNTDAKNTNEGDINITLLNSRLSDKNSQVLKDLKAEGYFDYTTSYKVENTLVHDDVSNTIEVKFVDPSCYPIYQNGKNYKNIIKDNNVVITKVTADKFNIKKGETISLSIRGFAKPDMSFKVSDISDSTGAIDENVIGAVIIDKSILQQDMYDKNTKSDNLVTNLHIKVNKNYKVEDVKARLEETFNENVKVNTVQDLIDIRKDNFKLESKALNFVEILIIIVTGTGISVTTILLTIKRKKDYVLLKVYGMNQSFLKSLIMYETFIICIISVFFGIILSLPLTWLIEKSTIKSLGLDSIIINSLLPVSLTSIFIIVEVLIFTMLPIAMSKDINPVSILREHNEGKVIKTDFVSYITRMLLLLTLCFSIYIKSLGRGIIIISILTIFILIIYYSVIGIINKITKIKVTKNKSLLLAMRNLSRQKTKFALGATALVITLVLSGIILNIAYNIIPKVLSQYVDDSGYNLYLNTDLHNDTETENVLNKEKNITSYMKSTETIGDLKSVNGKSFESYINALDFTYENKNYTLKNYKNFPVEALDFKNDMLKYPVNKGRWFSKNDKNKNYIVLGNEFDHLGITMGDKVKFNIQGKLIEFTVIGIKGWNKVSGDDIVYININSLQQDSFLDDGNSKLKYLIKCSRKNEDKLTLNLGKELKQSQVLNIRKIFASLNGYIQKLTYAFICICLISILSSACLVGNILIIINFERLKEFLVLKVLGAKNRNIRRITTIEGVLIGGISGVLAVIICEILSLLIMKVIFSTKYLPNFILSGSMILISLLISTISTFIVINNMKIDKYSELLREE